ncbi:hypothetical protein QQF64_012008 [Cirrhinus molitorella]|uniref:Uncharacterized protein n=1 Tax=Cirrhinus molitorella TaxID=172907 RepID=A0ABR3LU83_9TELE
MLNFLSHCLQERTPSRRPLPVLISSNTPPACNLTFPRSAFYGFHMIFKLPDDRSLHTPPELDTDFL